MKRFYSVVAISVLFFVLLPVLLPTYAAKVCPGGQFSPLCEIQASDNTSLFQNVFNILLVASVALATGFLLWGGIKWVTSGGDKGKVDAARGTITAAVVGLIVSFLAFFIVGLVSYLFGISSSNGTFFSLPKLTTPAR